MLAHLGSAFSVGVAGMLTAEIARETWSYNPETGVLRWKISVGWKKKGSRAGHVVLKEDGYKFREVHFNYKRYREHRVIWLIVTGEWPKDQIDHEDHDATNNKWSNLKEATNLTNGRNQKFASNNTSGVTGVCWHKAARKFSAAITVNGKTKYLGLFESIDEAARVRRDAELSYNFHSNHGK